ncbi:hypothetical protein PENSPDRAFT_487395 [Peniophora sp. CONT]|nr:hypothetical protein PENSPDRAFT_487395 [Peniophora sp. CONT]
MEAIQAKQKRAGLSLHDDPNMRAARPGVPSSASQRKQLNGAYVPSRTHFIGAKTKSVTPANPESDDEIDSLHGSAADSDDEERTRITRVPAKEAKEGVYLDVNGEKMAAHPNFLPAKKPLPKFKKKSQTGPSGSSTSTDASPASSQPRTQPTASGPGTPVNLAALRNNENGNLPGIASSSRTTSYSSLNRVPSSANNNGATRSATNKPLPNSFPRPSPLQRSRSSSLEVLPPEPDKKGKAKAKPKPAPFPLNDSPSASPVDSTRNSRRAQSPSQTRPLSTKPSRTSGPARKVNKRRIVSESESGSDDDLCGSGGEENTPRVKATRPPDKRTSPTASRSIPDIDLTEPERKPAARPKPRPKVKPKAATDFPLLSPLSSQGGAGQASSPEPASTPKKKKKKGAFPSISPLSSPASAPLSREKTAPFPMSMSPLKLSPVRDTPNAPIWEESEHEYEHIDVTCMQFTSCVVRSLTFCFRRR